MSEPTDPENIVAFPVPTKEVVFVPAATGFGDITVILRMDDNGKPDSGPFNQYIQLVQTSEDVKK